MSSVLKGDVVEALAVALEEAGKEAVPERLEQLDLSPAGIAELHPTPSLSHIPTHEVLAAEGIAVQRDRRLDRVHGDRHVVELQPGHGTNGM
jgi:hypothetical protein